MSQRRDFKNPLIKRLKQDDLSIERLFDSGKKYTSNIEDDFKLLKQEIPKGYLCHQIVLNFLLPDNDSSILVQKFIQQYLKKPIFQNNIVIKNTTNDSEESVKVILQNIPYEIIVAESNIPFFDFLIEISLDKYSEIKYNKIAGFYLNCVIKSNSALALSLDNYATPFIVINDEVILIKKNHILKKWIYQYIEKDSKSNVLRAIYITGNVSHINQKLISSLKEVLKLEETEEELKEMFDNNNILIRDQKRETSDNSLLTNIVFEEDGKYNSLNRIIFYYYFTIDKNKQKEYLLNVIEHSIKFLKIYIEECVNAFNSKETTHEHIFKDVNQEVSRNLSLLKKKPMNNEYSCFNISPNYNGLFRFICKNNNIDFGSQLLCVKKNAILTSDKCFEKLDEFYKVFSNNVNTFFDNELENLLQEVQLQ